MKSRWMLVLILVVLLFAGCGKNSDEDKGTLTPTGAGKATATPAITPAEMTSTPTPSAEPTATPTPTIAIPGRPEEYQTKALVQAAEDEIHSYTYAYRETMTLGSPIDTYIYFHYKGALGRDTRAEDPWELYNVNYSGDAPGYKHNSTVSYLDADLNCRKRRYLLNGQEVLVEYFTSLGTVFYRQDGTVLYDFEFKTYDDDGRLLINFNNYNTYQCYAYDEAGRLSVKAAYSYDNADDEMNETLDDYTVYTYDEAGRPLQEATYTAIYHTPELQVLRDYTYDENGNCISVEYRDTSEYVFEWDENGTANGRYDFLYDKDEQGRLSSRTRHFYSPQGDLVNESIIDFRYYDDGAILMIETKSNESESLRVVYPDKDMAESFRTCTNLDPIYGSSNLGKVDYSYIGYPVVEDTRDGLSRYQNLPVTKMPETRPLVVYYNWYNEDKDTLLRIRTFDSSAIELGPEMFIPIPYYAGFREGRLEEFAFYEGGSGEASVFTYDSEQRLVRWEKASGTTEYRYDANGRLVETISNFLPVEFGDPAVTAVSWYSYDAAGKLIEASTVENSQNTTNKVVTRSTSFLFEYSGDGTD